MVNTILRNGRMATLDPANPRATAVAIKDGIFEAVGSDEAIMRLRGPATEVIDLKGHTLIPGLNDSHTHVIRGGLHYNMELRWEGVPSVADALRLLKVQADRTPPSQWVRVVGGWTEYQFAERRMPTLEEINAAAPDTPVFILHLYDRALLNAAALRAVGFTKDTPDPPGGVIYKDRQGNPSGLLIAEPSALILYSTLAKGPTLSFEDQLNSSRHFQRELNRLGVTSAIDAGGGGQNYPDDYRVIEELHRRGEMTLRIAYNLFAQEKGSEFDDYQRWTSMVSPGDGDAMLHMNGAGENLVWSAADFENFLQPRPRLSAEMDQELERVTRLLVEHRWPFRIHATYDESIARFLDVFEKVNRDTPFDGLRFIIDHAETIRPVSIERVKALGGGIAIQHRMAFQGEYFVERYGATEAQFTPPITDMLAAEVPVGAGTDATRVASFNPWVSLYWLVTGNTVGGLSLYPEERQLDRQLALSLWTKGSAWFSGEQAAKGHIAKGEYADLAVLSADYFFIPAEEIKDLSAVLTMVGGKVVHGDGDFRSLAPPLPPASPDWSPVTLQGQPSLHRHGAGQGHACLEHAHHHHPTCAHVRTPRDPFWGPFGCGCFAF
ncbi:amidohydrolase [Halomonas heilongjiangensis]|uniref:Amidohydrolase n=1 Tax=Halomonas heilongjiangensis TaxID=1387883 RepID=A0A2N7TFQ8_9GAMM|nr:amidohydrolase [Halomonas heilongjiangensis]PMR66995.1 amidohydrolase [Halomonas heilongjiangensis]PXX88089.1 amidohydrolase [Halomonas heilongjiangensis]